MTYVTEPFLTEAEGLAGSLVIAARAETGRSQTELARRSGVPRSVISAVEHGRRQPSLPTLMKILLGAGLDLRTRLAPHDDQDVGRVHRPSGGKETVEVHDYVDSSIPVL
jgi:transcriptional regulator with XRE-family HTH domain